MRIVACAANLKQQLLATNMYADDQDGVLPEGYGSHQNDLCRLSTYEQDVLTTEYTNNEWRTWICPAATFHGTRPAATGSFTFQQCVEGYWGGGYMAGFGSKWVDADGTNWCLMNNAYDTWNGGGAIKQPSKASVRQFAGWRLADSNVMYSGGRYKGAYRDGKVSRLDGDSIFYSECMGDLTGYSNWGPGMSYFGGDVRHSAEAPIIAGGNIGYADGHVAWSSNPWVGGATSYMFIIP